MTASGRGSRAVERRRVQIDETSAPAAAYLRRACPACAATEASAEIATPKRAENAPFEELRSQWFGFFREKEIFSYARCAGCGFLYAPTYFTEEQLAGLYASMPPNMEGVPGRALEKTQEGYFRFLRRNAALRGDFLEIGPDIGLFAEHCAREGSFGRFWMFEPNVDAHAELRRRIGARETIVSTALRDLSPVPDGVVGVAAMIHVLDHLIDPIAFLHDMRPKMARDGVLLIVTHDESSLLAKVLKARFPAYCLQHPHLFNPKSMRTLLRAAGFETIRTAGSTNYFPLTYLVRHGLYAVGLGRHELPAWESLQLGLKLGNFLTLARPA